MSLVFENNKEYANEFRNFINRTSWDISFTISFNSGGEYSIEKARKFMKNLAAQMDHKLLGPNWIKKKDKRTQGIVIPEKSESGDIHYHGLIKIHDKSYWEYFIACFHKAVEKMRHSCSVKIDPIQSSLDQYKWVSYITKFFDILKQEEFIILSEFHNYKQQ